tara:strand:- start:42090 stop:42641 length:552 start_codon:yes stop_codon:yes gene_type:complete
MKTIKLIVCALVLIINTGCVTSTITIPTASNEPTELQQIISDHDTFMQKIKQGHYIASGFQYEGYTPSDKAILARKIFVKTVTRLDHAEKHPQGKLKGFPFYMLKFLQDKTIVLAETITQNNIEFKEISSKDTLTEDDKAYLKVLLEVMKNNGGLLLMNLTETSKGILAFNQYTENDKDIYKF